MSEIFKGLSVGFFIGAITGNIMAIMFPIIQEFAYSNLALSFVAAIICQATKSNEAD